ncbi:integrator complex subunit 15-like [Diadema antillarum]|uniref:integrator complex subunit 15-like n=1 Tax=Diadema antillarum TaxID=105358 RepID=UPI003A83AD94
MAAYIEEQSGILSAGDVCLWYSDIGQRIPQLRSMLGQMGFPGATRTLLIWLDQYFEQCENFPPGKFPNQEYVKMLIQEFIFYRSAEKNLMQMTAVQELQLLEELCHFFHENGKLATTHNVFDALFGNSGHPLKDADEQRRKAMMRLVSLAISVGCHDVLDCAAVWLYNQDCSGHSISLADSVMTDFCELVPGTQAAIQSVAKMSPQFTYHLLTALMSHFNTYQSTSQPIKLIPPSQLEVIGNWIGEQPSMCLSHTHCNKSPPPRIPAFHIHPSHKTSHEPSGTGPLPGLIWQSVLSPLILDANRPAIQKTLAKGVSLHDYALLFSKLHLGILQVLFASDDAKSGGGPTTSKAKSKVGVLTLSDIESVIMLTVHTIQDNKLGEEAVQTAVERIAQLLQVSMATGTLPVTKDKVIPLCEDLPSNALLSLILHGELPS